jgi:PAS domain-containing protein
MRFCSRCGVISNDAVRRVCDACEAGVLLTCRSDALPGEAFVICTYELTVTAVSEAAELIFGPEDGLLGAHLLDLATCPLGDDQLARHTALAAQRAREPVELPMRLRSDRGEALGMLAARVTTCGPPRAALVTVEPTGFGRR